MRYTTRSTHVDLDTGETISKYEAEENYHLIKTLKNVTINKKAFAGLIEYTKLYRRNEYKQGELFK